MVAKRLVRSEDGGRKRDGEEEDEEEVREPWVPTTGPRKGRKGVVLVLEHEEEVCLALLGEKRMLHPESWSPNPTESREPRAFASSVLELLRGRRVLKVLSEVSEVV